MIGGLVSTDVLVIGGGAEAMPVLRTLARLPVRLVVADGHPDAPGFQLATAGLLAATLDVESMIEAARTYATRAPIDAVSWGRRAQELGAGELLLTSWDRDGTRSGYDLELLRAMRAATSLPIIASGGAARVEHLVEAIDAGADAVLAASIFHDGETTCDRLKRDIIDQLKRPDLKVRH